MTTRPDPLADALRDALDEEGADAGDDALLARAVAGAAERLEAPAASGKVVRISDRPKKPSRTLRIVVPLAAAFAASVAMAAVFATREPPPARTKEEPKKTNTAPPPSEGKIAGPSLPVPSPDTTPSISVSELPNAKPAASAAAHASLLSPAGSAAPADLFRDANAARRAGDVTEAAALYRRLQHEHPTSAESQASRVSLGRLLLDKQGDATGALEQFDAYLKGEATDGALAEEARIGRALALQRLGKKRDERRAWEELVAKHPQSLYVTRARERLGELSQP